MSDTYNYADGAVHHDHHRSITINGASGSDLQALLKAFLSDEAEEVVCHEAVSEVTPTHDSVSEVSFERIIRAAEACQGHFWAQSSWAVVYCVCRDHLGLSVSVSEFERRVQSLPSIKTNVMVCHTGAVQKALTNNDYMRFPITRWPEGRALKLAQRLENELGIEC